MYERIRKLCEARGWTVKYLESLLGLGSGSIGKWKTSSPRVESFAAVAHALGVTMEFLLFGDDKNPPQTWDGFTEDEVEIIQRYRSVSPERKALMLQFLRSYEDH